MSNVAFDFAQSKGKIKFPTLAIRYLCTNDRPPFYLCWTNSLYGKEA